jgi:hypothetical protein
LEQKPAQFVTLLSLSLSLQIEAASENHNWEGLQQKNGITEREREREHKQGPQKAPTFEGGKGDKRKKKKNLFLVPNSTSNIISIL